MPPGQHKTHDAPIGSRPSVRGGLDERRPRRDIAGPSLDEGGPGAANLSPMSTQTGACLSTHSANPRVAHRRRARARLVALAPLAAATALFAAGESEPGVTLARGAAPPVSVDDGTAEALEEARDLFRRERSADLIGQFTNERLENLARPEQLARIQGLEVFQDLFLDGDDAFRFQADGAMGARTDPAPVHTGELGGADGASCRACHFQGGPDGSGSSTQRALFRGDGTHVSSAVARDAPHVMGLGYISRLAREMEAELAATLAEAEDIAATTALPVTVPLVAKGVSFGELVARPGEVDRRFVEGISSDLIIRPFGHKGRHSDLVTLVDEALQIHHGLQTASRLREFNGLTSVIGGGDESDPDEDGVVASLLLQDGQAGAEASSAQAPLIAGYLSLLGVPEIHPPQRADLLVQWTRGHELLDDVGCTLCHVEKLSMNSDIVQLQARAGYSSSLTFSLEEAGQEPRALRTDFGVGAGPGGTVPLFLYSDLKRHDLGEAMAEADDEVLPDGAGAVSGSVWLTRPLWGLAETAPYMADGRAPTVHDAIVLHGGEAAGMRDAYLALRPEEQAALRVFLMSLSRRPVVLVE